MLVWMELNTVMNYRATFDGREVQVGLLDIITILPLSPMDPPITEFEGLVNRGLGKERVMVMGSEPLPQSGNATACAKWLCGIKAWGGATKQEERCGVSYDIFFPPSECWVWLKLSNR